MSFTHPKKSDLPVFDIPSNGIYQYGFVDRRATSIAGRSFLSEKNQPVKPSTNQIFRKCYSAYDALLYKLDYQLFLKKEYDLPHRLGDENNDYSIPIKYFYPCNRLASQKYYPYVNPQLSEEINSLKIPFNKEQSSFIPDYLQPQYSNKFYFEKHFEFSNNKSNFIIQEPLSNKISEIKKANILSISSKRFISNISLRTNNKEEPIFENYISQSFFFDKTKFDCSNYEYWSPVVSKKQLPPSCYLTKLTNRLRFSEEACDLKAIYGFNNSFTHNLKTKKEKIITSDLFAHFYLTFATKLIPFENLKTINNNLSYKNDISNKIENKQLLTFANTNLRITKPYCVSKDNLTIINKPKFDLSKPEFTINNSEINFFIETLQGPILAKNKVLSIRPKYKNPKLALKLKLKRPSFTSKELTYTIAQSKELTTKIIHRESKKIKAKYSGIKFTHLSPVLFENKIVKSDLKINKLFKQRKSRFFNKCPKHALYTYNLLHKQSGATLNNTRKLKFKLNAFSLPHFLTFKTIQSTFQFDIDYILKQKVRYCSKKTKNTLKVASIAFSTIEMPLLNKIDVIKGEINKLNQRLKFNLNRLKSLKVINSYIDLSKYNYHLAYLNPIKRILTQSLLNSIHKQISENLKIKNYKAEYQREPKVTDNFALSVSKAFYSFANYLPKQIVDTFEIILPIITIPSNESLSQKEIVPPPDWPKIFKAFICKLRLGPYPFGFPDFYLAPPTFSQMVTKANCQPIDTKIINIFKESNFILTKAKLYLSELSMKNPRRLLHSVISPSNSPKEFYVVDINEKELKQNQPKNIYRFNHYWDTHETPKWTIKNYSDYSMLEILRAKKNKVNLSILKNKPYGIEQPFLNDKINTKMPGIRRFLLRSRRFRINKSKGLIQQSNIMNFFKKEFINTNVQINKTFFAYKHYESCILQQKETYFAPDFPIFNYANEKSADYKIRYRSFRFPYVPEEKISRNKTELFSAIPDYTSNYNCKFQEDFRVSQFEFGLIEIKNNTSDNYLNDFVLRNSEYYSIETKSQNIVKNAVNKYILTENYKFKLKKTATPTFYKHLISPKFFKCNESLRYKFMLRGQMVTSLKHTNITGFNKIQYYYPNLYCPHTLESASYHWVILLKKNSSIITKTNNYYSDSCFKTLQPISISLSFENKIDKENYFENLVFKPEIDRLSRVNLNEIRNASYRYITLCEKTEINEKPYSPQYNHISFTNIDKNHYSFAKVTNTEFIQQNSKSQIIKLIEPPASIKSPQKREINYPVFSNAKPFNKLDVNISKNIKTSEFRPFYIPELLELKRRDRESFIPKVTIEDLPTRVDIKID